MPDKNGQNINQPKQDNDSLKHSDEWRINEGVNIYSRIVPSSNGSKEPDKGRKE